MSQMEDGCSTGMVVSTKCNCACVKPKRASVGFCLRAFTISVLVSGSEIANDIN